MKKVILSILIFIIISIIVWRTILVIECFLRQPKKVLDQDIKESLRSVPKYKEIDKIPFKKTEDTLINFKNEFQFYVPKKGIYRTKKKTLWSWEFYDGTKIIIGIFEDPSKGLNLINSLEEKRVKKIIGSSIINELKAEYRKNPRNFIEDVLSTTPISPISVFYSPSTKFKKNLAKLIVKMSIVFTEKDIYIYKSKYSGIELIQRGKMILVFSKRKAGRIYNINVRVNNSADLQSFVNYIIKTFRYL